MSNDDPTQAENDAAIAELQQANNKLRHESIDKDRQIKKLEQDVKSLKTQGVIANISDRFIPEELELFKARILKEALRANGITLRTTNMGEIIRFDQWLARAIAAVPYKNDYDPLS